MTDTLQPAWLEGFTPKPTPTKWKRGMASPNPLGRPTGSLDKRTKVTRALMDDAPGVARVVIDAALAGDMQAASLVLSRCAPVIKAQAERVQFELCSEAPLANQAQQILQAVADGKVDPDTGRTLIGCLNSVAGIRAVADLEERIVLLEAKEVS